MRGIVILTFLGLGASAVPAPAQTVNVWLTTHDQSSKLQQQPSISFMSGGEICNPLQVDETRVYQEVEGFGASFTDSAAYLLNQVATPSALTNAMNDLFTRNGDGIGVSFVRNPMGASDLTRFHYSYDDNPPGGSDPDLDYFSIAHDQADIIPLLQYSLQLNPDLTVMGSPWSPPGWMKDSGSMIGGSLLSSMNTAFANYFVKYIQAYEDEGIPVHYVSLQNEPLYVPGDYPGMGMSAEEQRDLLRDYILPVFTASNISTRIVVFDHNWYENYYPEVVLADPVLQASSLIAGTAWHGYGGTPGVMLALANQYPTKGNYQTEHSGGLWVGGDENQIVSDFTEITHVMRSAGKAYVKWGLALDENRGPNDGGCNVCSPLVIIDSTTGAASYTIDYDTLGHFSKFVLPGAHRIYSANASGVVSAAFENPDGSKALITFNDTPLSKTFQVLWGTKAFSYTLEGYSGATFTWSGVQSGSHVLDPSYPIQASSFDIMSGLMTEPTSDTLGGYNLGYAENNDYAVYRDVDFTGDETNVNVRVASSGGGNLEFRLNSPAGTLISSAVIPNTGDWQNWQTISAPVTPPSGVYDLYLVFKGGSGVGNVNWFRFEGAQSSPPPGPVSKLIWQVQPDLATNGIPFTQQPLLLTADGTGSPSTNGLPETLEVVLTLTAGIGPLSGTTNLNIGTSGWNGSVQFTDLQIDAAGNDKEITAATVDPAVVPSGNRLLNGDFNSPDSGSPPDNWSTWTTGTVAWANHENKPAVTYDGSYYMVVGGQESAGGACHQTVHAVAGWTYELSVLSGADAWWLPYGEIRFYFLNCDGSQVGYSSTPTLDPDDYGNQTDIPHPWQTYTLSATAPSGASQLRVELMSAGTGSIWYENAVLTEEAASPALASATTLPFSVAAYQPPTSQTNYIESITHNGGGIFTLQCVGTMGVQYFVEAVTNLAQPIIWEAMPGSTNLVTDPAGLWDHTLTNQAVQQFFRSSVVTP